MQIGLVVIFIFAVEVIMQNYEIIVEWNDKASNILYEKRTTPKTLRGAHRQLANVVRKDEEYFAGYDVMRLTVTAV